MFTDKDVCLRLLKVVANLRGFTKVEIPEATKKLLQNMKCN